MRLAGDGSPEPQGVTPTGDGANVAVFSAHATAISLCVFDAQERETRIPLPARTGDVFHGHVAGLVAGTRYGLRAEGPWQPDQGHRFDPHRLLLDPFAAAVDRRFVLHESMFSGSAADSAPFMPKAIVLPPPPPPPVQPAPASWAGCFIYELHVRGFSMRHPEIPPAQRGTFAALAHPAAIAHFRKLGVTTLEIMPASAWIDERHLPPLGLSNYWGYNPVSYLAPDPRLAPGGWAEIRAATDALAAAGIDVVLDVVFNHSGEGDAPGPTLSLRGLDNASYYRLPEDDRAGYVNDTGCGNTLALDHPQAVRLAMEAMRVWVQRGGIGGFRFDLATTLGRRREGFDPCAPLLTAITQDPLLRGLRLVAEPWDIGPGGYRLGAFPPLWGEWNDRFRDGMRRFWGDHGGTLGEFATRFAGSSDIFAPHRPPSRSVNFLTAHDGFTLADLVSYRAKANQANGEGNRDGTDANLSWNNGVEGDTDSIEVRAARARDQRALLACLLLARGTPMLAMGTELGHSQGGNNNAYAQDNALSWLDWSAPAPFAALIGALWRLRQNQPALAADRWLHAPDGAQQAGTVTWRAMDGSPMTAEAWQAADGATMVMQFDSGGAAPLLVIVHRGREAANAILPATAPGHGWVVACDTADLAPEFGTNVPLTVRVSPRSVLVLAAMQLSRAATLPLTAR